MKADKSPASFFCIWISIFLAVFVEETLCSPLNLRTNSTKAYRSMKGIHKYVHNWPFCGVEYMSLSYCCYKKLPRIEWLKTADLSVCSSRGQMSKRGQQGSLSLRRPERSICFVFFQSAKAASILWLVAMPPSSLGFRLAPTVLVTRSTT